MVYLELFQMYSCLPAIMVLIFGLFFSSFLRRVEKVCWLVASNIPSWHIFIANMKYRLQVSKKSVFPMSFGIWPFSREFLQFLLNYEYSWYTHNINLYMIYDYCISLRIIENYLIFVSFVKFPRGAILTIFVRLYKL